MSTEDSDNGVPPREKESLDRAPEASRRPFEDTWRQGQNGKHSKRTSMRREKVRRLEDLGVKVMGVRVKQIAREILSWDGPKPWTARQRLAQIDARVLAHGGRTGVGITRPRQLRAGDPIYTDRIDAAGRRWLPPVE